MDRHADEIIQFSAITTPQVLQESELATIWRQNKFTVKLSSYSYELLISFLHEYNHTLLLSLVNLHIKLNGKHPRFFNSLISFSPVKQSSKLSQALRKSTFPFPLPTIRISSRSTRKRFNGACWMILW